MEKGKIEGKIRRLVREVFIKAKTEKELNVYYLSISSIKQTISLKDISIPLQTSPKSSNKLIKMN